MGNSVKRAALIAAACNLFGIGSFSYAQHTWISTTSGNWSNPVNWLAGGVPPAGGSNTVGLTFLNSGAAAYTATNDLGNPFALNTLTLSSFSSGLGTIAGDPLAFGGANAAITNSGTGPWTITNAITLNGNVTLGGNGGGSTNLTGVISGTGALVVNAALPANNLTNIYSIGGGSIANTYTGGTVLNSGMLNINNFSGSPLGSGPVTVNGGVAAFGSSTGSGTVANNFTLNSSLNVRNAGFLYLNGVLSGPGGLNVRNQGNATQVPAAVQLRGANTYTGPTVLQRTTLHTALGGIFGNSSLGATRLRLNDDGSILNTSSIEVQGGGGFIMDNAVTARQRVGTGVPLAIESADIQLIGNSTSAVAEKFGTVTLTGHSSFAIVPDVAGARLGAVGVSRPNRGSLLFKSTNMGLPPGPGNATFFFDSIPLVGGGGADGTTTISIVPFAGAFVSTSPLTAQANPTDLVTHGVNGIRMLTSSEYAPALGGNPLDNVRLVAGTNNDATHTLNALVTEGSLNGTGNINVTSGLWMTAPLAAQAQNISNNINFGSVEGNIYQGGANASSITINGVISGSNGLTKSGHGNLFLNNVANNFTGAITINAGVVSFADPAALGNSDQIAFTYNGGVFPALQFTGTSAALAQNVVAHSGHFRLTTTAASSNLTFNGVISGPGGIQSNASGAGASIRLTGNNTFLGGVRILNGDLEFSSDANLGDPSGGIDLGTNTASEGIRLLGNWTTSRPTHVSLPAGINTQSNNATLNGVISGTGAITKVGSGALALNADNTYTGAITVGTTTTPGGTLAVNGATISQITVTNGTLGGDGRVGIVALNPAGAIAPGNSAGSLTATSLVWNGDAEMIFELGSPGTNQDRLELLGALNKGSLGTYHFDFSPLAGFEPGIYTLITFGSNNGFVVSDFTYTAPTGLTGEFILTPDSLQFQAVPEPTTPMALAASALVLLRRRQRRTGG